MENTVRSRFRRGERVRWKVDSRVEYKVILAGLLERIEPGNKRRRAKKGIIRVSALEIYIKKKKMRGGDGGGGRYRCWRCVDMYTFFY